MLLLRRVVYTPSNLGRVRGTARSPCRLFSASSALRTTSTPSETLKVGEQTYPRDAWSNATPTILGRTAAQLHRQPNHPLNILAQRVKAAFPDFAYHDNLAPDVSVYANFDALGFPADHPGRSRGDTYYLDQRHVLRTHTSAHQIELMAAGEDAFLVVADVYRRDEIDASHYPVFHQVEGLKLFPNPLSPATPGSARGGNNGAIQVIADTLPNAENPIQEIHREEDSLFVGEDLKRRLENMVVKLFRGAEGHVEGKPLRIRWVEAYFPFTSPSWELEVEWEGQWLELLGCGVIQQPLIREAGLGDNKIGWAFGIGLERLAMVLFGIPDIRLFWSQDPRFLSQFQDGHIRKFIPFSQYPPCTKDVSFWLRRDAPWAENDLMEVVREAGGDWVESVALVDGFTHPKTGRESRCYRITYRSMERTITNEEINLVQDQVRSRLAQELGLELR